MTDDRTNLSRYRLVVSPDESDVKLEEGFGEYISLKSNGRAEFSIKIDQNEMAVWLVGKAYGVSFANEIKEWAAGFGQGAINDWAMTVDGDWVAIVLDRVRHTVHIVSDRNGASRVYYAQEGDCVAIAGSLWDIIPLLAEPKLSSFSAFTLLSTYYTLDPYTLVEPARVTMPGVHIEINSNGIYANNYYEPVQLEPSYYKNEEECVHELDRAFHRVFEKRVTSDRIPMVLLSGGIDSVTMVRYLSDIAKSQVHTLTFSVTGQERNEHEPARIAAKHFGTVHHELVIEPMLAVDLFVQACIERNIPNISSMLALAARNYVSSLEGGYDIFSGEDTRLHTPDLDVLRKVGMKLNLLSKQSRWPLLRTFIARMIGFWPWYPKGFLRNVGKQIRPYGSPQEYFIHCLNKFKVPGNFNYQATAEYEEFMTEVSAYCHALTVDKATLDSVSLAYRLQYTDNLATLSSLERIKTLVHAPFYDWDIVQCCNRIPVPIGAKGIFTFRSWSRFLMVNKRVLRQVLRNVVPESILYRRKAVASAVDVLLQSELYEFINELLNKYFDALLTTLGSEIGSLASGYIKEFRAGSLDQRVVYATLSICYMALIYQICLKPTFDVDVELKQLRESIKRSVV